MARPSGIMTRGGASVMSRVSKRQQSDNLFDLPPIPTRVITPDGQQIDTTSSRWEGRSAPDGGKYQRIDWSLTLGQDGQRNILTKRAWYLVKLYLADRLSKRRISTIGRDFD